MSSPIPLTFRTATLADASQIQHLVQTAFRTHDPRPDWTGHLALATSFRHDEAAVRAHITADNAVTLLAFAPGVTHQQDEAANKVAEKDEAVKKDEDPKEGVLAGSVDLTLRNDGTEGRLSMIAVDDRFQRGGVGKRLLAEAEAFCAREWKVEKCSLDALSTRPALAGWYERRGYVRTGEKKEFPREVFPEVELPGDMCFIEMEKRV